MVYIYSALPTSSGTHVYKDCYVHTPWINWQQNILFTWIWVVSDYKYQSGSFNYIGEKTTVYCTWNAMLYAIEIKDSSYQWIPYECTQFFVLSRIAPSFIIYFSIVPTLSLKQRCRVARNWVETKFCETLQIWHRTK